MKKVQGVKKKSDVTHIGADIPERIRCDEINIPSEGSRFSVEFV